MCRFGRTVVPNLYPLKEWDSMFVFAGMVGGTPAIIIAVCTAITTAILFGSAIFALWNLQELKQTRYADLIADLSRRWDEPFMRASRVSNSKNTAYEIAVIAARVYRGSAQPADEEAFYELQALPNFIETLGVIEYDVHGLDILLIRRLWGSTILQTWDKWSRAVGFLRRRSREPRVYANFELLVRRIRWLEENVPESKPKPAPVQRGLVRPSGSGGSGGMA
jgi:hypothetical protein